MRAARVAGLAGVVHRNRGVPVADVDHHAEGSAGSLVEVAAVARVAHRVAGPAAGRGPDIGQSADVVRKVRGHGVPQRDLVQVAPAPGGRVRAQAFADVGVGGYEAVEERFVARPSGPGAEPRIDLFEQPQQVLVLDGERVVARLERGRHPPADLGVEMPPPPDLEQRGRGAVRGEFAVPAAQELERRRGFRRRFRSAQQREQAAGRDGDIVRLKPHRPLDGHRVVFVQHFADPLATVGPRPLPAQGNVVAGWQVHLVGGGHPAAFRVELDGQFVHVPVTPPLVAAVAGHRQQAVPVGANRREAARLPADVAVRVGVDLILGRRAPAVHRGQELVPVARPDVLDRP